MFCGKCGFKMSEADPCCPRCGWTGSSVAARRTAKPHYFDNRTQIADENPTRIADDNRTVFADELPQSRPPQPQWEAPVNFDYDEPRQQSFPDEVYYPTPAPGYRDQTRIAYSDDELIPKAYRTPNFASPKKKSGKKGLIIAVIIASAVVLAAAGLFAFQLIYTGSEDYKIQKAETEILNGSYETGLKYISEFHTAKSNAVREFTELLQVRDSYADVYNAGMLQADSEEVGAALDKLNEKLASFSSAGQLPDGLKKKYKSFIERLDSMNNALEKLSVSDLYDAQLCVLEFKKRKTGESFTIGDLESIVDTSSPAISSIEKNLINNDDFKSLSEGSTAQAVKTMNEFYGIVSAQNDQDKFDLENYKKTQRETANLMLNDTNKDYEATVGTGLKPLKEKTDAEYNANLLVSALKYAWTAYAFDIT